MPAKPTPSRPSAADVTGLPDYVVFDPALERLPLDRLRALQAERLMNTVRYVYARTPFWRRKFDEAGLDPLEIHGLEDLRRIPFCTKEELQADQLAHPPFGSYVGCDRRALVRFMTTSGTTGRPLRRVFSSRDWGYVLDRLQRNSPVGAGDVVVTLGPVDGLLGPMASAESHARAGALVILAGLYDSATKLRLIEEVRPVSVSGAASYLLHLIDVARREGIDLPSLGILTVISAGEPGAAVPSTRQRLSEGWGAFVRDGYGLTEMFPLGGGCRHSTALHIASDLVIAEIVDPESGEPVPPGTPGEVVYTNIVGDTQPLLRYRTRDIARLSEEGPCACGFTGTRLANAIEGRIDDMLWVRGVNVFPSAVESVVRGFVELGDEYEIVLEEHDALPKLRIRVELKPGYGVDADLTDRIQRALVRSIRVSADLELLPFGTLARSDGRTKRRRVVRGG
jgi:phenylacetate-CoA ligase